MSVMTLIERLNESADEAPVKSNWPVALLREAAAANTKLLAALKEIEGLADDAADVDDGTPNLAMKILVIARAAKAAA